MKITNKLYSVRVSFKTSTPNVKLSPSSMTGIVTAKNEEEAKKAAVNFMQKEFIKPDSSVYAVAGKPQKITSKFAINAEEWV